MGFELFGVGVPEMIVILVVALIFLGPERLPEAARSVGTWVREIRALTGEAMSVWQETLQVGDEIKSTVSSALPPATPLSPSRIPPPPVAHTSPRADAEAGAPTVLDYPPPFGATPPAPSAPADPLSYPAPFERA